MNDFNTTSAIRPSSAHDVALNVRKMEKQQAEMVAELRAEAGSNPKAEKKNKRLFQNLLAAILVVFGSPRPF